MEKNCKRCHLDLGPHHGNRQYHPACNTAAANEVRRAERSLGHDANCRRCHLDLGPHHGNREYHPACQKVEEAESRQAKRALDVDKENEQQRARYAANRASGPLLNVKCSYRTKGIPVHRFKTRDKRRRYCSDDHRDLGTAALARAADRKEYAAADPKKHRDKNRTAYMRRMQLAVLGKRWEAGERVPVKQIEEITKARITLAACLEVDGVKPYEMTNYLYPPAPDIARARRATDHTRRFDATKKLLGRQKVRIGLERQRLAALPEAERNTIRRRVIHTNPQPSLGDKPSVP